MCIRDSLALYPYYQTARLLMLKNLYLLHDPSFDEELRRAAIYITDRKIIFEMVEACLLYTSPYLRCGLGSTAVSAGRRTGGFLHA